MKKHILALAAAMFATLSMSAATVSFDTVGSAFYVGANPGSTFIDFGKVRLSYETTAASNLIANPISSPGFGQFVLSCLDLSCTTADTPVALPANTTFTLVINQFDPTIGTSAISSTSISGSLALYQGFAQVTWANPSTTIGVIKYTVSNSPLNIRTVPTNLGGQSLPSQFTSIQGTVEDQTIPEPSTYAMIGGALVALAAIRRRK